jgi:hypothetical protein
MNAATETTTYKFGVMSGAWLLDASTDRVADAAMLLWLRRDGGRP